jgi:hypothetical protein
MRRFRNVWGNTTDRDGHVEVKYQDYLLGIDPNCWKIAWYTMESILDDGHTHQASSALTGSPRPGYDDTQQAALDMHLRDVDVECT